MKYITYRELNKEGEHEYYILQKDFPHFCGLISTSPKEVFVPPSVVSGYNLWIVFNGCLRGFVMPSYNGIDNEIMSILEDMAVWFYENRIVINEKKFKKFKLNSNVTSTNE